MEKNKSATAVGKLIDEYITHGVFRAVALQAEKGCSEVFRIVWFQNQSMTLRVDQRKSIVRLLDFIPTVEARSSMDRNLRAWLRGRSDAKLPPHRRLDPKEVQVKLTNKGGHMQLAMRSLQNDRHFAARKLLFLSNELYLEFLSAPAQYNWIVETFELDPDNPRWP